MTRYTRVARVLSLALLSFTALSCQASSPASRVEIGMTVHFRGADDANFKRQFDLMAAMNVTWVRLDIDWSAVESEQSQLNWDYPDKIFNEAAAHGMNVVAVLAFSPSWANKATTIPWAPTSYARPGDPESFANFARVAAQRYAARGVRTWEIWNEPNTRKFWRPNVDADQYGELFRAAASAIRGIDPKATLLIGGLAPLPDEPGAGIAPQDYLDQLYDNGAAQLADGVAVHPYTFPDLPLDANRQPVGALKDLVALHAVMDKHADGHKKIWITEFGAPTGTGPTAVSEQNQALTILQARRQVARWDWAGPLIYYELVDGGTDPTDVEMNFGVLRENLDPKPAAIALMESASRWW
jgi:hypothetical protein